MKIHNCIQYSPEWWKIRAKKITGSHAQAIATQGAGLKTYITEMMADYYSSAPKENFSNKHTERGILLEPDAAMVFSFKYNLNVKKVGFVEYNKWVGVSPDIFIGEDELGEIKCLADKGHFRMILGDNIDSKFIWQLQMQLLVCKKKAGYLIFYNPSFSVPLVVHRLFPDQEKFEKLRKGFALGEKMIEKSKEKSMLEETYIQTDDQYSQGIVLDEYHGKLSLCSAGL